MIQHHITVPRTARYYTLGSASAATRRVWFVCHGYGQLAETFLQEFSLLDDGSTLIVAPEALSRFYPRIRSTEVGASWMTREDRSHEIDDYVRYLDDVHDEVMQNLSRNQITITLLGFSQGTATVGRWAYRGRVEAERLILWGGLLAPEIDFSAESERFKSTEIIFVAGREDRLIDREKLIEQCETVDRDGLRCRMVEYDGGHVMDRETLGRI